jgi:hypothetical protein
MPLYLFEHTKTGEVHEVIYHMNDPKDYRGPKGDAKAGTWRRVWTKPQAAIDTKVDPYSAKDYLKATNRPGTVGDLWDRSRDMSIAREDKEGVGNDPIQKQFFTDYSKRRKGRKHPEQVRAEGKKQLADKGIRIDYGED